MEKDVMSLEKSNPKYEKPKVLLIDLPDDVLEGVRSAGYNASAGTFGSPYEVDKSDGYTPVILNKANLPYYAEQEIIFVDLTPPETRDKPEGETLTDGELYCWAKCSRGEIDPRPLAMWLVKDNFNRILQHGGLFVIFAERHRHHKLFFSKKTAGNQIKTDKPKEYDNWSFLSSHSLLDINVDFGEEIRVIDYVGSDLQLFRFLRKFIKYFRYNATLHPYSKETGWIPILRNKFGDDVGGLISLEGSKGLVSCRSCNVVRYIIYTIHN